MDSRAIHIDVSDVKKGSVDISNIVSGSEIVGDIVGRDKIINNITNIIERSLTTAEEAEKSRSIAIQRLAEGVKTYAERLRAIATGEIGIKRGNPYQGLLAFSLGNADLFFGRTRAIDELQQHLRRGPLTVLQAESGAGKSSLLQAGIAPYLLKAGHLPVCLRPYNESPTLAVKQAFLPQLIDTPELADASLRYYLCQVTAVLGSAVTLYLILDQFEETFTLLNKDDRDDFVKELAECLDDESLNVRWVLALRSEFFGHLATFRPRIRQPFENDYRLNCLSLAEARSAIVKPAARQGVDIEPALVDAILEDLKGEEEEFVSPPQIQLVCLALYDLLLERQAENPDLPLLITTEMYETEQRAQGILRGYLNRVLQRTLSKQERELARQLLIALVSADQRRVRRTRSELAAILSTYIVSAQNLDELLAQLVDCRLLHVDIEQKSDETCYELIHDYLVDEIEIDPDVRAQKAAQELLAQEVEAYKRFKTLLSEDKFNIINRHREFLPPDQTGDELLRLSQEKIQAERERELNRQRALTEEQRKRVRVMAVAGIVALILAALAVVFGLQSQRNAVEAQSLALASGVQRALSDNNTDLAIALALEANSVDQPRPLARIALAAAAYYLPGTRKRFVGHTDEVTSVAFNPKDGRIAVSGSADDSLILWELESGKNDSIVRRLVGHTGDVNSVAFGPDGRKILSGSSDNNLILWDAETGQIIRRFVEHSQPVRSVAFSFDGRTILSGSDDGNVIVWDVISGEEIYRKACSAEVSSVQFSPNGRLFAAGTRDDAVCVWDVATGEQTLFIPLASYLGVTSLAFTPDSSKILVGTGGYGPGIHLWDITTGELVGSLSGHIGGNIRVALSPDGRYAATGAYDNQVVLWNFDVAKIKHEPEKVNSRRLSGHTDDVTAITFSPDGSMVLSGSKDHTLRLWDISSGAEIRHFTGFVGFALSPDGSRVAASQDYFHPVWIDSDTGQIHHFEGDTDQLISLAFSPDGRTVFSGDVSGNIHLWDVAQETLSKTFKVHPNHVTSIAVSPDGRYAVSGSYGPPKWPGYEERDDLLILWKVDTGQIIHRFVGHNLIVRCVAINPDGRLVLSGSDDATVRLWDTQSGEMLHKFTGHTDQVLSVAFGPQGKTVLSASADQTIRLWDIETGREIRRFSGHMMGIKSIALSPDPDPDRRIFVSGSDDGSIRLWDVETGLEVARITLSQNVWNVAFGSDGLTIWSRSKSDNTIRLLKFDPPDNLIQWTCNNRYVRELSCTERLQYGVEPYCNQDGTPPVSHICQSAAALAETE